ncbi:MAG: PRC-barrel domain-containing protein [Halanaerobiales bacterium]
MIKLKELHNLPVISMGNGALVGEVKDILISDDGENIEGLIIVQNDNFFVPGEYIYCLGDDIVIIKSGENLILLEDKKNKINYAKNKEIILGNSVINTSGKELGVISDLLIDEKLGKIVGYELSGGVIQDLWEGRNFLTVEENLYYGQDVVIVGGDKLFEEQK